MWRAGRNSINSSMCKNISSTRSDHVVARNRVIIIVIIRVETAVWLNRLQPLLYVLRRVTQ